jgi:hypothetical protein
MRALVKLYARIPRFAQRLYTDVLQEKEEVVVSNGPKSQ